MDNQSIRNEAKKRGVKFWQIADELGISEATITRKLRHELSNAERERFLAAINRVVQQKAGGSIE